MFCEAREIAPAWDLSSTRCQGPGFGIGGSDTYLAAAEDEGRLGDEVLYYDHHDVEICSEGEGGHAEGLRLFQRVPNVTVERKDATWRADEDNCKEGDVG